MKRNHSPLITISKRSNISKWKSIVIRVIAGVLSLILCGIISCCLTNISFFGFFGQLFSGAFGTQRRFWNLLEETALLLIIALAITPAFKMKFWNIGAEGQVLIGGLASAACMFLIADKVPNGVLLLIMLICSVLAGAIWALIPAIFKAKWNTNETLFTLMMNYIAMRLVAYMISVWVKSGSGVMGKLPYGHIPTIGNLDYLLNVLIVVAVVALLAVYFNKSKHGYEINVVGESVNTARYVGINVKLVIIRTMLLSGALCGLAGFILVAGDAHTISETVVGGRGFTAILISWLAGFNPIFMIVTSFLVGFITKGSSQVATVANLGKSFPDIMTGIFFFVIIASEFFVKFNLHFHFRKKDSQVVIEKEEVQIEGENQAEEEKAIGDSNSEENKDVKEEE